MPDDTPLFSVIVPTFNRAGLAAEAVESVRAQSVDDVEVLVVDDGSTDVTAGVMAQRFGDDPRVRYLPKANGGVSSARNFGLTHARGSFVSLLDSDDLWAAEHLASQRAILTQAPDAALSICDARYEGGWPHDGDTVFGRPSYRPPTSLQALCEGAWALPSCWTLRRDAVGHLRFDEMLTVAEDADFLFRVVLAGGRIVTNPDVLTRYRYQGDHLGDDEIRNLRGSLQVLERYAGEAEDSPRQRLQLARRRAQLMVHEGRWREARPHLATWLRLRFSSRALRWWFASFWK